jgi:uncharacterized protein with PIN domain
LCEGRSLKFLVDAMLGKLARWLRILGQNVVYSVEFSDSTLLKLAKDEGRVLLTKDFELYQRAISKGQDAFYVEGKTGSTRLAKVAKRYGLTLSINMDKSHCPFCNTPLKSVQKEEIKDKLELNTYTYYDIFWSCPCCGQIYWQGAHWKQIIKTLIQAQQKRAI